MPDDYQIHVPASFHALYADRRQRLQVPLTQLRQRYELCEDLAQQLVDAARALHFDRDVPPDEVLMQLHAGLCSPDSGLSGSEAMWVVRRLAELLEWTLPRLDFEPPDGGPDGA